MASKDTNGDPLPVYDGSTWDPFAGRLLLTTESNSGPSVYQATLHYPSQVAPLDGVFGRADYEGVQADSDGRIWLVEDSGGAFGTANPNAKQPNSFVYRFTPSNPGNLRAGGKLEALQVLSLRSGNPIVFHDGQADQDITSPDRRDLHTYGKQFQTRWVTVHDNATDGMATFDANAIAKARGATPFKRPENGVFRPGSDFRQFVFTETGDTNALSEAGAALGGYGALYKLSQPGPGAAHGTLSMVYRGNEMHTGFDNVSFSSANTALVAEDAGDTLHTQRNAFDSLWAIRTDVNYGAPTHRRRSGCCTSAGTHRPPSTPASQGWTATRTRVTTRSPASTSQTAMPRSPACSVPRSRTRGCPDLRGGCSSPPSTATTTRGS